MAGSTTTTLNDLLPSIVAEAMFVANERSIMRGLVKNYSLAPGQGKTVTVPIYPLQTATPLTEGNEIDNTAVSTSGATLTISTAAIRTLVTDLARNQSSSNVIADLGRLFGEAIARKIDVDLTALFAGSFTKAVGNASTTASPAQIFQAVAKLKQDGVPTDGIVAVLSPAIAYDIKAALTTTGNTAFTAGAFGEVANEAMRMGFVGMLAGVPVYESGNLANNGTAGDYYGAIFHRDAFGLAMVGDISIETQRRASYLGDDVIASCHYGVGTLYENYAVQHLADSTIL